ncbi:MAG: multicopper oxidase family protein [Actinobacteria bacterium]|nr:multicopper oxidase family protein [Actinomycetota bacterium]
MAVSVAGHEVSGSLPTTVAPAARACASVLPEARREQCERSLLPPTFSMMRLGYGEFGGGPGGHAHAGIGVDLLRGPAGAPTAQFTLRAAMGVQRIGQFEQSVMTFNGTTPGPVLTVTQGDLIEVRLENADVVEGVTIHWHGVDVPAGDDGVAGVTQDAVLPGDSFVYRFVVPDAGTYWYHSHQDSAREVRKGLFGALVVLPRQSEPEPTIRDAADMVAVVHTYGTTTTLNGRPEATIVPAPAGGVARVRFINANNGPALVSTTVPFKVISIDGTDLSGATDVNDTYVDIPAGGRADLLVPITDAPVRVGVLFGPSLVIGPTDTTPPDLSARTRFDPLVYGTPGTGAAAAAALGTINRDFPYRVGSRKGYLDGRPGTWFTINAGIVPNVPMFMVRQGDVVRFRITNATGAVHPMHLHGHHALVVSRDGTASRGAPWWVDSLEVDPGQTYVLLLRADNPGMWMFHCHNLPHARAGLMTHLGYEGVSTPFLVGRVNDRLTNHPE